MRLLPDVGKDRRWSSCWRSSRKLETMGSETLALQDREMKIRWLVAKVRETFLSSIGALLLDLVKEQESYWPKEAPQPH